MKSENQGVVTADSADQVSDLNAMAELGDLQLAIVGGGFGEVVL
jgi:hypothetical protein